jgi:hypothetical protein
MPDQPRNTVRVTTVTGFVTPSTILSPGLISFDLTYWYQPLVRYLRIYPEGVTEVFNLQSAVSPVSSSTTSISSSTANSKFSTTNLGICYKTSTTKKLHEMINKKLTKIQQK